MGFELLLGSQAAQKRPMARVRSARPYNYLRINNYYQEHVINTSNRLHVGSLKISSSLYRLFEERVSRTS